MSERRLSSGIKAQERDVGSPQWRQLEKPAPVCIALPIRVPDCLTWPAPG